MDDFEVQRELEAAWAAGFFDGEGCTGCYGSYLRLAISQNDPRVLYRFKNAVKSGRISGPHPRKDGGNPRWQYSASGSKAEAALDVLLPYLGPLKQEQIHKARAKRDSWV